MRRWLAHALGLVAVMGIGGCQAVLGLGDLSPADSGAPASDATPPKADATVPHPDAATEASRPRFDSAIGVGCTVLYVSAKSGSDDNSGCDPQHAALTIVQAVQNAATIPDGTPYPTIEVCTGTYSEHDLSVDLPISIRGNYDCDSWLPSTVSASTRASGTVLQPDPMNDDDHPSTLRFGPASPPAVDASSSGRDASTTPAFLVDGLTVYGSARNPQSIAVDIQNGARPLLSNNTIVGVGVNTTTTPVNPAYAVAIRVANAAPEISANVVSFAGGQVSVPAVGIFDVVSGPAMTNIHDNVLEVGPGVGGTTLDSKAASVGVEVEGLYGGYDGGASGASGGVVLTSNLIVAGDGVTSLNAPASVGVAAFGLVNLEATGNVISGGAATFENVGAGMSLAAVGVDVQAGANATLIGNRIFGGVDEASSAGPGTGGTAGVFAVNSRLVLANNLIHGGDVNESPPGTRTRAVALSEVRFAVVEDNTLYAGSATSGDAAADSVYALEVINGGAANLIRGNILAGNRLTRSTLYVDDCAEVAKLERNLFLSGLENGFTPSGCKALDASVSNDFTAFLAAYGAAAPVGNLLIAQTCAPQDLDAGRCSPDCPDAGCMPWLLTGWNAGTPASGLLTDGGSWALQNTAPCSVAHGGVSLARTEAGPPIEDDIADATRPLDGPSIGARQYQGSGCASP